MRSTTIVLAILLAASRALGETPQASPEPTAEPTVVATPEPAPSPQHPLDPLSEAELRATVRLLRESGEIRGAGTVAAMELDEPEKAAVLAWKPGDSLSRKAFAVIRHEARTREAIVDLTQSRIESWHEVTGAQTGLAPNEMGFAVRATRRDPRWQEAIAKRGFGNPKEVVCIVFAAGSPLAKNEEGRRLVRVLSYDRRKGAHFWGYPVEGLVVTVDLDRREVFSIVDSGVVDMGAVTDEPPEPRATPSPNAVDSTSTTVQPAIAFDGNFVRWERWSFHLRVDARVGTVVSLAGIRDGEQTRSVLYQGYAAEVFVPYMDPAAAWQFRTFFDAGEFGIGKHLHTLIGGRHCPKGAAFRDALLADHRGLPSRRKGVVCVFERATGDPTWAHTGSAADAFTATLARELVVRSIATLGNYDYAFDWIFREDGSLRVGVGATGVALAKRIGEGERPTHGRLVDDRTVAIHHDHFFGYRLDLDVDGTDNSLVIDQLERKSSPKGPRRSLWDVRSRVAEREKDARLHMSMEQPAIWRVIRGENAKAPATPSYEIHAGHMAMSLLDKADVPQRRAGFTRFALWATPYRRDERYPAGDYPYQSRGNDGLPTWTAANRKIADTDLVLWYTLGFHHVVRREDWPIMPTSWHWFELRPFDFFDKNPLLE